MYSLYQRLLQDSTFFLFFGKIVVIKPIEKTSIVCGVACSDQFHETFSRLLHAVKNEIARRRYDTRFTWQICRLNKDTSGVISCVNQLFFHSPFSQCTP